jgi:hypothetical protein
MKRFLTMYKPYLRPIIYKLIPRLVTGLVLSLLWDRFFNAQKLFSMTERAFFVLGIVFLAIAWVNYLKLDGIKIHHLNENRKKTKHKLKFPIDYSDEEPSPADLLDENENAIATLISNIAAGICFLLPSVFSLLFS